MIEKRKDTFSIAEFFQARGEFLYSKYPLIWIVQTIRFHNKNFGTYEIYSKTSFSEYNF